MGRRKVDRLVVMSPTPPPYGGIVTIGQVLRKAYAGSDRVVFVDTAKKMDTAVKHRGPLEVSRNAGRMLARCLEGGSCHVISFSGYGLGFYEKCGWMLLARAVGAKSTTMLVDGHFPSFYETLPLPKRRVTRALLESFETLIVQSEYWESYYRGICPRVPLVLIDAGVDADLFCPRERDRADDGRVRVLFLAWWIEEKGLFDLLEAAEQLRGRGVGFELRIAGAEKGNGDLVRDTIARRGLEGLVTVMGNLPTQQDVIREYQEADVYVLPSYFEGLPNALLEAMSCGVPPITTTVGGIPDVVRDGASGLLIPPRAPGALARALERLIGDADLRVRLGEGARARVLERYTFAHSVQGFRDYFDSLLAAPS